MGIPYWGNKEHGLQLYGGDCLEVLKTFPDNSVDSVVTDPPYGLSFMGKKWDYDVPSVGIWEEVLRVLKPGGHLLAFAGTRTQHRMCCNIEDAGFEIRDMMCWMYGSGFPKSLNVSKAIPATDLAKQWEGFGTALKPSMEPITLARKPLSEKTIAKNILEHGTGGINVDGCRVGLEGKQNHWDNYSPSNKIGFGGADGNRIGGAYNPKGRFPANVIFSHHPECKEKGVKRVEVPRGKHAKAYEPSGKKMERSIYGETGTLGRECGYTDKDGKETVEDWGCHEDCAIRILDEQSGDRSSPWVGNPRESGNKGGRFFGGGAQGSVTEKPEYKDKGGASRFFYCAKASKKERTINKQVECNHPTVKPIKLMRYLIRLVTPPNGIVLDPFVGSGTTMLAAYEEGFRCKGIEKEMESFRTAMERTEATVKGDQNE